MFARIGWERMGLVLRYLLIGGLTFCTYFIALYAARSKADVPYPVAVAMAYCLALLVHFTANRSFTFRSTTQPFAGQLLRYGITALINYGLQVLVIFALYRVLGVPFYVAALAAVLLNLAVGFLLQLHWVFTARSVAERKH